MEFSCSDCNYKSSRKQCVENHINRKNKCGTNPQIVEITTNIICEYCNKNYATKDNLSRHYKTCKDKKNDYEKELIKKDLEIAMLKAKLNEKPSTIVNIQNIQNLNVNLNGYRNTSFEHLNVNDFKRALNRCIYSVPQLIKDVHFNGKIPENHNIYISNIRGKYAMVYNGKQWEAKNQKEVIDDLIRDHEYAMDEWLGGEGEKYPKEMEKFNKYLEKKDDDEVMKIINEEIKLTLYNNRDKIMKSIN